jgi:diguanylate cyclase (GGDEF)-like protein
VHAGVLVASVAAGTAYVLSGPGLRPLIFALVTLVPIATFLTALGTGHLTDRWPWLTATAGLVLLSISMAFWSDWVPGHHLGRAEGRPADFVIAAAHLLFLCGTGGVLRKHGSNDPGGMLDAALFGVCTAGPVWAWLIAPRLTAAATPLGEMLVVADVAVLAAVMACLVRIGARASRARGPIGYLMLCCVTTLAGHVAAVLTAAHGTSTWTVVLLMLAYLTIAAAPVHPAARLVTHPDRPGRELTGEPPLAWMGAALCANPLIAAIQAVRGDPSASVLLPVGSMLAVPLVLLRLRQMSVLRGQAERTLAHHAHHDDLTGLHNRRHVGAEIDRALADLDRGVLDEVTVLLFDLDGFKPVNDRFGHQAGDAVLRTVAARLTSAAGPGDVVGRIGGDEFVVLRRGRGPAELPGRVADLLDRPIEVAGTAVRVGVSAGAATARPGTRTDRDTLIGRADAAMYAAKAAQRKNPTVPAPTAPQPVPVPPA